LFDRRHFAAQFMKKQKREVHGRLLAIRIGVPGARRRGKDSAFFNRRQGWRNTDCLLEKYTIPQDGRLQYLRWTAAVAGLR